MFYRICDHISPNQNAKGENDIYRKFEFQFSNLFNQGEIARTDQDFEDIYIHDIEFESRIDNFMKSINSTTLFCVGYTGIGKTTAIRHCFNLGVGHAPTLHTPSKLSSNKHIIIFPTFLDGFMQPVDERFDLSDRVSSVCTLMEKKHPELLAVYKTIDGLKDFYSFIQKHTPHILESRGNILDLARLSEEDYIIKRLDNARQYAPLEFCVCKLKYYISKKYDIYDRLVIILDDIETLPEVFQERIIIDYFHLFAAMQNTEYPQDSDFRINLLISLRPHTFRNISKGMHGRRLSAFPQNIITKNYSVDLEKLFKKRFDFYTKFLQEKIGNSESWKDSYEKLMLINQMFDGKYKNMICNLCFMNIRAALAEYSKILSNRFWIQKDHEKLDAFTISANEFAINNITVLRAIGCGNSSVFTGDYNHIIPNFFYTTRNEDYSIQCLLVMKYFRKKLQIFAGGTVEYGLDAEELRVVYSKWNYVLDEERVKQLRCALEYLFECKILRKSIIDFDDYRTIDTLESLDETSRLYISPRGIELMNMFDRDSILLEMLRESAWRNYNGREEEYSCKSSYELIQTGHQSDLYIDLLEYVEALLQAEEEFFFSQQRINLYEYCNLFGDELVTELLISGIEKSLRYSGMIYNSIIARKYNQVIERIAECKTVLLGESKSSSPGF